MTRRTHTVERIRTERLIAVIRTQTPDEAVHVGRILVEVGISLLEVTFTVPNAPQAIERLCRDVPQAIVGAGSVIHADDAQAAIQAGAQFVVSPVGYLDLVDICHRQDVVAIPAGLTPTEVLTAYEAGAAFVKVFPADAVGGAAYLRALLAPLPHVPLIPTGGVTMQNVRDFLQAGAVAVGVGGALTPRSLIQAADWAALKAHAARFVAAMSQSVQA